MRDPSAMECRGWNDRELGDAFRINRESVVPLAAPTVEFVHYSIPAWDATREPALQRGAVIESNKTAIRSSSVLVSKLNPRKPRVAVVIDPPDHTCCSTEFICYQPKRDSDDLRFWAAYFASNDFAGRLANIAIGSTNSHTRAAPPETLAWQVPDVPGEEQRKIADLLDTLDTAIHQTEAIIAKLKLVKQGLLHDLLTRGIDGNGELRPPQSQSPHLYKPSPLGWIPQEWGSVPFGKLCESSAFGPRFPSEAYDENGPIATLRTTDMGDEGNISLDTMPRAAIALATFQDHFLEPGDIVISRSGTCGIAGVFTGHDLPVVPGAFLIRFRLHDQRLSGFYRRYFNSVIGRPRLVRLAEGGVQKNIKGTDVLRLLVPVLPPEEAITATARIGCIEHEMGANQRQLEKFLLEKSGLMDDLLTGRVRVTPLLEAAAAP